ncbi:MAG: YXWGXW repeat-containing protein [Acidobacteriota bacterium]|nr:YXWGXW repeat-containing protein [Acidobacteriota bacterium]
MHATLSTTLKSLAAAAALAACTAVTLPASAQVGIGVQIGRNPPPPMRYERRPPMPGPGYAWVDGYWAVDRGRYVWVPGRWNQPPYPGAYWSHPHYDHYQDGWRMHEGHWDREDHGDHVNDRRGPDGRPDGRQDDRQDGPSDRRGPDGPPPDRR